MRHASLTTRLLVELAFAQPVAIVVAWLITALLTSAGAIGAYGYSLEDFYSYYRIRDLVAHSLARGPDNALSIDPVPALRAEMTRTPTLRFAVFKAMNRPALPGSSEELAKPLESITSVETRGMEFFLPKDVAHHSPASLWRTNTPFGPMFIAASGSTFYWTDPLYALRNELPYIATTLAVVFLMSAFVAWLALRRSLAPVRKAAEAAEQIQLDCLGQGLSADGTPAEILPLVEAINRALNRLDASAMRMRRYIANAAHELRTPIAILRARLESPEESSFRTDLKRDVRKLQAIIEQMLISARLTENQATLAQEVDLVREAREATADYSPLIYKAGRRIAFEPDEEKTVIRGNKQAVDCVIANLLDNALRAEPQGGTVLVRVRRDATIEIVDHGEGVAEEDRDMIFEPFWRKSEAVSGTGLGLAISREVVEKLGGRIWVEETPHGGATFKVAFQRCVAPEPRHDLDRRISSDRGAPQSLREVDG